MNLVSKGNDHGSIHTDNYTPAYCGCMYAAEHKSPSCSRAGPQGAAGTQGTSGTQGATGAPGYEGAQGETGKSGGSTVVVVPAQPEQK